MFVDGLLKEGPNGKYEAVTDPNESELIRSQVAEATK